VKTIGGLEADGGVWSSFTVTIPPVPADHWKAEYFGNTTLSGAPVATVDEGTGFVDHSWGTGGPAGLSDHFSARFTRTVTLAAGTYRFTAVTDDGNQLWVDEQLHINAWGADGLTTHTVDLDLAAGDHALRFQYVEHTGGATAQLTWVLRTPVVLASGESLGENQTRVSLDGAYRLQYQGDGNLVVVRLANETCAWSAQTNNTSVGAAVMQGDGNLVVYDADWVAVWNAGTNGYDGARLEIANDALTIVAPGGAPVWTVSLLAAAPGAAAEARTEAAVWPRGPFDEASAGGRPAARSSAPPLIVAVLALAAFVLGRQRDRWGRWLRATALLLTALLLLPATALAQTTTQVVEFYHTDALGSVRAVTKQVDDEWAVVSRHDFMPFGEEVAPQTPPPDKRLFTGKERDSETGLDYFEARYYRADLGRFTTVDPELNVNEALLEPQQWNRYAYVKNNPLRYTDPNGKFPVAVAAAIPGPQQIIVAGGLAVAGGYVVYKNREVIASELSAAWNATSELLGRGVQAARDATDAIVYSKSDPGRGLREQIAEHERKLADYIADPAGHHNKGFLKDTTPEQRAKIIDARIRELQKQIENFKKQLRQVESQ
jgi:RHS repeat-associated protein